MRFGKYFDVHVIINMLLVIAYFSALLIYSWGESGGDIWLVFSFICLIVLHIVLSVGVYFTYIGRRFWIKAFQGWLFGLVICGVAFVGVYKYRIHENEKYNGVILAPY